MPNIENAPYERGAGSEMQCPSVIDFSLVPEHVRKCVARATYQLLKNILDMPGGRQMLDECTAARHARLAEKEVMK
jgi:hypothetical protein